MMTTERQSLKPPRNGYHSVNCSLIRVESI
jgi:hypothetical protein